MAFYELASDSTLRNAVQLLAVIGGLILVYLAYTKVKNKKVRTWMYIIGGGTVIADTLFLVLT